jgi:hypothetical protein
LQEIPVTSYATAHPSHPRLSANPALSAALAVALIAAATLAGAWFFQLVLGIVPCPLCLEQRYAYYLAIPLGLLVALLAAKDAPRPVLLAGLAVLLLAALANAWFGTYHAGVEWKFWQGPTDCTGRSARHRKSGSLRRGAVAFSRPLARRLQRADLVLDGRDRGVGPGFGEARLSWCRVD